MYTEKSSEKGKINCVQVRPEQGLVSPAGQGSGVPRAMSDYIELFQTI